MPRRYLMILIVFPLAAIPAWMADVERQNLNRAVRAYAQGSRGTGVVVGKVSHSTWGSKGSSSTRYIVDLETSDGLVTRQVRFQEWERAGKGETTTWYRDPQSAWGCSDLEKPYLTDPGSQVLFLLLALAVAGMGALGWWQGLPGGAAAGKVSSGASPCPETRNLRLPNPEREAGRELERWLQERYPRPRILLGATFIAALAIGLPAGLTGFVETSVVMLLQGMLGAAVILLAHRRGTRRDRLLWRRGVERHAEAAVAKRTGNVWTFEAAFDLDGRVYTIKQRLPVETDALRGGGNRIVVLVDPQNPRCATVVPKGAV